MMEENFKRAMLLSGGNPTTFLERPISAVLLAAAVIALALVLLPGVQRTRATALKEE